MTARKRLCFILPGHYTKPIGGYKVAYEYANRLAKRGFEVTILYRYLDFMHANNLAYTLKTPFRLPKFLLKKHLGFFKTKWFKLDPKVTEVDVFRYDRTFLAGFDCLIATSLDTACGIHELKLEASKKIIYLIQDFESWGWYSEADVLESYRFGFTNIVIAPWLAQKVSQACSSSVLIPNGFDFDYFKLSSPIEGRNPLKVCMMNHYDERKRCTDTFAALKIVKERFPALEVNVFGVPPRPTELPPWFHYFQTPDRSTHNFIYNDSAIYVAASKAEGFALPPGEALICGCALVCTDIGGFGVLAKHEETALLSPVFDVEALAKNIIRLIEDNELRIRLAKNGNAHVKTFTWESSERKFLDVLSELLESGTAEEKA